MATFTRDEVASRILSGEHLLIFRGAVLRIPQFWLDAHPGGGLSILHYVGRDATDEIRAYHANSIIPMVEKYAIGTLQEHFYPWDPFLPPVMAGWNFAGGKWTRTGKLDATRTLLYEHTPASADDSPTLLDLTPPDSALDLQEQARLSERWKELHSRIEDLGLYQCRYISGFGPEFVRYSILAFTSWYTFQHGWLMTSAVFLGLFWHQVLFFVHDLGHLGVTGNWNIDRLLAILAGDLLNGLSIGWWSDNHNIHHLVTNHPMHDPDIEYLPFFVISPAFFGNLYSTYYKRTMDFNAFAKVIVSIQHKLFYVVMLFARFNLFVLSYGSLYRRAYDTKRARGYGWAWGAEIVACTAYWCWFGRVLVACGSWQRALSYLLVCFATTSPLHVTLVLSHFAMSTADLGPRESFVHRQIRTTTDIYTPPSLEFIHGGLQMQVAHHLFPRVPRHNLRAVTRMVRKFCEENDGIEFHEYGFFAGNKEVYGVLKGIAEMVEHFKVFANVANTEAMEAVQKQIRKQETRMNDPGLGQ
ncbi:delta 8-sphingoloid desaturase protein [Cylindrobasidium torrendii FP15055 ss-10]|uniref:Delta 8-(E)-sphingolipid desaturase n=1 Tax=Cylindrobasidium torrendii FP15055 ss-10 TaxID=1314674 RepID=A0A0D7B1L1_9AGAR|nr:delta 8-sphingoloid desaturase protein [Cylindrobasidium torrendii FP15055 ss-10]